MIEPDHPRLSIVAQCRLVSISRSGLYRKPAPEAAANLDLMRLIDEQFMATPWYGSRQMVRHLRPGRPCGRTQAGPPADGEDRPDADLPEAKDHDSAPGTQEIQIPFEGSDHHPAQPCVVLRHHLHPDATRVPVSGRGDGLGDTEGPVLEAVEHHGGRLLH